MFWFLLFHLFVYSATYDKAPLSFKYDDTHWEVVNPLRVIEQDTVDSAMHGKTLVTLQRKNADEKYRARFSIVLDTLEKIPLKGSETSQLAYTLAYTRYAQNFFKSQRFAILESRQTKIGTASFVATDTVLFQRDFGLKFRQIIFVKGDHAYLLTLTSRMGPFADYEKEIETVLSSLTLADSDLSKHTL